MKNTMLAQMLMVSGKTYAFMRMNRVQCGPKQEGPDGALSNRGKDSNQDQRELLHVEDFGNENLMKRDVQQHRIFKKKKGNNNNNNRKRKKEKQYTRACKWVSTLATNQLQSRTMLL